MIHVSTCVLFALHREATPFLRAHPSGRELADTPCPTWIWEDSPPLLVLETGMGSENTQRALDWIASHVTSEEAPLRVISAGFAGALSPRLKVSDVVAPRGVIDQDGSSWSTSVSIPNDVLAVERSLHVDRIISTREEKRRLHEQHRADFVDMESAIVGRACHEHGWSFGCLRAISDTATISLSPELGHWINRERASVTAVLRSLLRSPVLIVEALRLAIHTHRAAKALARALSECVERS